MVNSRDKGKKGELEAVRALNNHIGEKLDCVFKRNLSQTQESGQSDIVCSNPNWDFEVEVKRHAKDGAPSIDWRQVKAAATKSGKIPVLWTRADHQLPIVHMEFPDVMEIMWGPGSRHEFDDFDGELISMKPQTFFKLALEQSYRNFHRDPNRQLTACQTCGGSGTTSREIKDPTGFPYSIDVEITCRSCKGAGEV